MRSESEPRDAQRSLSIAELKGYAATAAGVLVATGAIIVLPTVGNTSYLSLLYLLVVIGTALRYGTGPAILASLLSFVTFSWSVLEPRYTLTLPRPTAWPGLVRFLIGARSLRSRIGKRSSASPLRWNAGFSVS